MDKFLVNCAREILLLIPGRVSIEIDARCSFDMEKTIEKANDIITLCEEEGINKDRILIKIAASLEGIQAMQVLESQGIHCNMTLIFSLMQSVLCAEKKATIISPFIGRTSDWYENRYKKQYSNFDDPGLLLIKSIYDYLKKFDYPTQIMGASFRTLSKVLLLSGCDYLTISPSLLDALANSNNLVLANFSAKKAKSFKIDKIDITESNFNDKLKQDPCAFNSLFDGISKFSKDTVKLEEIIKKKIFQNKDLKESFEKMAISN